MKQADREQGGVLSFIIIGVALTAVLVGGILLAKQQARIARGTGTATVSENQTTDQQSTNSSDPSSSSSDSSTDSSNANSEASGSSDSSTSNSSSSSESTGSVATTGPSGSDIPSTGPSDTLVIIVGLAGVTAGVYSYRQSARRLRASALK